MISLELQRRMASRFFVRRLETTPFVAARVLGSHPYPNDHDGFGLKYLNRISNFRSIGSAPLPSPKKIIPFFVEEKDFNNATRKASRLSRGKAPTPKGVRAKGLKKKK